MEILRGKMSLEMDEAGLAQSITGYHQVVVDLGTGDGRFVRHLAETHPGAFVIGVDACRENLHAASRVKSTNTLFVIANVQSLPCALHGLAQRVTINFPWGSLLDGLLQAEPALLDGIAAISRPGALLDVRLNAAALAEAGWPFEKGACRVQSVLLGSGFGLYEPVALNAQALDVYPSTWARRLAHGRDPRAVELSGMRMDFGPAGTSHRPG
jgi:16S rRNA (adenine(1408)-N(1))-methyltransferase